MIINTLTNQEFEKLIKPILKLEDIVSVKSNIYEILHFTKHSASDKRQYIISSENTGIRTIYMGFNLDIKRLSDPENDYTGVILQFKRERQLIDYLINPLKKLVEDLKIKCNEELFEALFKSFDPGGLPPQGTEEIFQYQLGTLNPNWREDKKLSPLTIFTRVNEKSFFLELIFCPECYERKSNKTTLKEDWLEIFRHYTQPW